MTPREAEKLTVYWTAAQQSVAAFIRTLVPKFSEADDILQRVAVVLVQKFDEYDPQRPFVAWAIGMAKLEIIARRREIAVDRHVFDDLLIEQIAASYERLSEESPDQEFRTWLSRCLDALDVRARQAIQLRYENNWRTLHIAAEMALTDGAVRKLLSRARNTLRDCVNRQTSVHEEKP
jgi:RNA polymerase sigma-70 factor (ECF subfamily)